MREYVLKLLKNADVITERKFYKKSLKSNDRIQYAYDAFKYAREHRIIVFDKWVSEDNKTVRQYIINH